MTLMAANRCCHLLFRIRLLTVACLFENLLAFCKLGYIFHFVVIMSAEKRVCVVVLGDIGRSPRMTFHSLSLAQNGFKVDLVGYSGSIPSQSLLENENIALTVMKDPPAFIKSIPLILGYAFKVVWVLLSLLFTLIRLSRPSHILVQNPPSVPMLAVVVFYSYIRSCKMIIDWHNYGYTILGLTMGINNPLVKFTKWFEFYFGKKAEAHLCVTEALKSDLENNWKIRATVLYDRPPDIFHPIPIEEKHDLFQKLSEEYSVFNSKDNNELSQKTAFTVANANGVEYRDDRPALIISSTSWTPDEDFSILFDALEAYDNSFKNADHVKLPKILCVITGKGPMRDFFVDHICRKQLSHVTFCLPWLSAEDYPKLLACADLGVSLHTSSSGLDLPMKVVDMFGCGLPVVAYDFNCLAELVKNNVNGLVFQCSQELSHQFQDLLRGFPKLESDRIATFQNNLKDFQNLRWDQCWTTCALHLFE